MIYAILSSIFWGVMYFFQAKLISKGMNLVTLWGLNMITGSYLGSFFIYLSLKHTDVSSASIIEMTYPVFILLLLFFVDGETPNSKSIMGFVLIFVGSILIFKK